MSFVQSTRSERVRGAVIAIAVQALLGYALIAGLAVGFHPRVGGNFDTFQILPDPLPPPVEKLKPHRVVSTKAEGAASPPNLRSKATELVAPPPIVPPPPQMIVAAEQPAIGNETVSGNAEVRGPGTGSGGEGDGTGSGRYGEGDGSGGREIAPRQTGGRIKRSDWPHDISDAGIGGKVSVRYVVTLAGRASDCEVTASSGYRMLDVLTCRLIEQRFRFKPARDEDGRPVLSTMVQDHYWENELASQDRR